MRCYMNIRGRIVLEAEDTQTSEVLWAYQDVTGVDHDKYYYYIHTTDIDRPIKLSKRCYRVIVKGET